MSQEPTSAVPEEVVRIDRPDIVVTGNAQLRNDLLRLLAPLGLAQLVVDGRPVGPPHQEPTQIPVWVSLEQCREYGRTSHWGSTRVATRMFEAAFHFKHREPIHATYDTRRIWGYDEIDLAGLVRYLDREGEHGRLFLVRFGLHCEQFARDLYDQLKPKSPKPVAVAV